MNPKKHLSFGSLIEGVSKNLLDIPEHRETGKTSYSIHDTMLSGLACMFFQDPSLVEFQKRLSDQQQSSNLHTLFKVKGVPKESQMREIIDRTPSAELSPVFKDFFSRLQRGKHLKEYEIFWGEYLCPIDGTQYFSSNNIHCEHCLKTEHKNEGIIYSHKVLQAGIMHPDKRQIIPLMPEEIRNEDGQNKQDCEINAAKRLIPRIRKDHPQLGIIIVGDGLYSKQPMIEKIMEHHMSYILVVKETDHKWLTDWVGAYEELERVEDRDEKGRKHVYEWINEVPLNGGQNSIKVNYFRYQLIVPDKNGEEKVTYKNSWVTDKKIRENNIRKLVSAGRCRWKIENECFNTLKNQGYQMEHNYGHGKENLCYNFFLLTLLAFYLHQIMELTDPLYQACRKKFGNKRYMWETLRGYIKMIIYGSWEALLSFALSPPDLGLIYG